jgi:DNA-binding MarR family transcriptional regulator
VRGKIKMIPSDKDIETTRKLIRSQKFIYISAFSNAVSKYVALISKKTMANRTGVTVLTQMIVKGGSLHPTELAKLLWISKHSMTKIIDKLEQDGLVVRHRIDDDRRAVIIQITSFGLDFIREILNSHNLLWKDIINSLDENEQEELMRLLHKMVRSFPRDVINAHLS